jgi:hypothetical protein
VLEGIDASDRIVVNPPDSLEDNEQVNLAATDAPGAAGSQTALPPKR